jgi:hypothetical protein
VAAQAVQLVADLRDASAQKRALFTIKDSLLTAEFARAFVEAGGYHELCRVCLKVEGNTLSYGLSALHVCVLHFRDSDADKQPVAALEQEVMQHLAGHFEHVHTGTAKGALELFVQLNRRRKIDVLSVLRRAHSDEEPLASLVRVLGHSDVDCHQRALTLINAVVASMQHQPLASKLALYGELARAGIFERLRALRASHDVMVVTQLCAFQITRFALVRERMATAYDKANADHEAALLRLWSLTFPNVALESRVSPQWSKVGFQGTDPATDFRGFGVLGLDAMLHFAAAHTDEWRLLIERNLARGEREYPVATAVINACKLVNDIFHIADGSSSQADLLSALVLCDSPFEALVHIAASIIDRLWDEMSASYMQFPSVVAAAKLELEAGAHHYASLADWHAALCRGDKAPTKAGAALAGGGSDKVNKALGAARKFLAGSAAPQAAVAPAAPPAAMPRPITRQPSTPRKATLDQASQSTIDRLRAQLAKAEEEIATLRKAQPPVPTAAAAAPAPSPPAAAAAAAPLSPALAARGVRAMDEIVLAEVFLDDECVHSGRSGGVYFGTWYADRVAVRIFGSEHAELAQKWRQREPLPALNADARLACRRELQRLMAVVHPNVVICLGSVKGAPALLYELHSCDLRNYMQQFNGTLDAQQRSFLALDAARALSFLHRRAPPIVVGNVSTAHFLVDSSGNVRISSLYGDGAHLTNKANPAFGDVASAAAIASWCRDVVWNVDVAFAAREVLARGALSTASDVYALGVVLFEVLTGAVPWADAAPPTVIADVLADRLPFAAQMPGTPETNELRKLVLRCTNALANQRPSALDVALKLLEFSSSFDESGSVA